MNKNRAIPHGYMTVGEIAKKMGITVRTMQHYDREGVLSPSETSEGGLRLYSHKDAVRLFQVLAMKHLGFSLADIKTRLPALETPQQVSELLTAQAEGVREQIEQMKSVLKDIEKLDAEVKQIESVDWEKYALIVWASRGMASGHWLMKHMGENTLLQVRKVMNSGNSDNFLQQHNRVMKLFKKAHAEGHAADSPEALQIAAQMWTYVMEFTDGDPSKIQELIQMGTDAGPEEWQQNLGFPKKYIGTALLTYLSAQGKEQIT